MTASLNPPLILPFSGHVPAVHETAFVAPSACVIGRVTLGPETSVWFGSVLRGDVESITIGARSNLQDRCVVHVTTDRFATTVGDDVTVGHGVVLHGCRLGDRVLVGIGAIVLDDVEVGDDCLIGAGALLTPRLRIPPGHLVLGSPAKVARPLRAEELAELRISAGRYVDLSRRYRAQLATA